MLWWLLKRALTVMMKRMLEKRAESLKARLWEWIPLLFLTDSRSSSAPSPSPPPFTSRLPLHVAQTAHTPLRFEETPLPFELQQQSNHHLPYQQHPPLQQHLHLPHCTASRAPVTAGRLAALFLTIIQRVRDFITGEDIRRAQYHQHLLLTDSDTSRSS
eukprot:gnl/Spiro4/29463_TR14434_c0_g2_i1.p1 gnl/Spiro4/29463_TR14434_c0_g2~~gnl/Spiro4/29463_TR14434_c0_g2_i1.p1  ORF type:complete len:159 (-),score=28.17 gnl/Spiro4/29463_TR14434_c0_g2_i1:87-563(-)